MDRVCSTSTKIWVALAASALLTTAASSCTINPQPEPPSPATAGEPGGDASGGGLGGQSGADGAPSAEGAATGESGGAGGCDDCNAGGDATAGVEDADECDGEAGECEASVDADGGVVVDAPDEDASSNDDASSDGMAQPD